MQARKQAALAAIPTSPESESLIDEAIQKLKDGIDSSRGSSAARRDRRKERAAMSPPLVSAEFGSFELPSAESLLAQLKIDGVRLFCRLPGER